MTVQAAPRVFSLSIHANYRCRHSGACCTSGWAIPVEAVLHRQLEAALESGRLRLPGRQGMRSAAGRDAFATPAGLPPDLPAVLKTDRDGACLFFDRAAGGLCSIQRQADHSWLPSSCRHFPRVCLLDARGTFITLSHYCPTVARTIFRDEVPLEVVADPPAFPATAGYEGLDARAAFAPLLRPGVLFDLESYDLWERFLVGTFATPRLTPEQALVRIRAAGMHLQAWRPDGVSLRDEVVRAASGSMTPGEAREPGDEAALNDDLAREARIRAAVPSSVAPPGPPAGYPEAYRRHVAHDWRSFARPVNRYLAAKAFANWSAYQGQGVLTSVRLLEASLSVLRIEAARVCQTAGHALDASLLVEAVRAADLLLVHLASREDLAAAFD